MKQHLTLYGKSTLLLISAASDFEEKENIGCQVFANIFSFSPQPVVCFWTIASTDASTCSPLYIL